MDILSSQENFKCIKHPNNNILFVQVNQLQDNKQIFYCDTCILNDCEFKTSNYVQCHPRIANWPPIEDNSLNIQIRKMLSQEKDQNNLISQIDLFFDKMKREIIYKIDDCHKQIIRKAQELPKYEDQILETLQEIKLVDSFKAILLNSKVEMNVKEKKWREFINQVNQEMQNYTKKIQLMFDKQKYFEEIVDFQTPNKMKTNILQMIEDINFFINVIEINEPKQIKNIDLLPHLQIIQSTQEQRYSKNLKMKKLENNSIQIISSQNNWGSYYSNLILDRNKKYIFRFSFQRQDQKDGGFIIGLSRDETKDTQDFFGDKLACYINYSYNNKGYVYGQGIDRPLKGDLSKMKETDCLELRVCIQEELLEVVDYPNYNHRYTLSDKTNLWKYPNFRVGIYVENTMELNLICANICEEIE